jgi:hypothetical protein
LPDLAAIGGSRHDEANSAGVQIDKRGAINRYLTILVLSAPAAAIVWFSFHGVYVDLTETEKAAGYVDPLTQTLIFLGYVAMIGGTLVLGAIALWAAIRLVQALLRP